METNDGMANWPWETKLKCKKQKINLIKDYNTTNATAIKNSRRHVQLHFGT